MDTAWYSYTNTAHPKISNPICPGICRHANIHTYMYMWVRTCLWQISRTRS